MNYKDAPVLKQSPYGDAPILNTTPIKEEPKKGILGQTKTEDLNEGLTGFEKFMLGALPIAGAVVGGTSGFVADVLTPFTPGLETYVGGGLGAAGGRALSDKLRPLLGGKDVNMSDLAKRATLEGVTDIIGTKVFNVAMPIIKPIVKTAVKPLQKGLEKVSKGARKATELTDEIQKLSHTNKLLKEEIDKETKTITGLLGKETSELNLKQAVEIDDLTSAINNNKGELQKEINRLSPKLSRFYDLSRRVVSREYDGIKKMYGDIEVDGASDILSEIKKLEIMPKDKTGQKILEKLFKTKSPTGASVGDMINLERDLAKATDRVYSMGGSASNEAVNGFIDIRNAILTSLEDLVPEQKIVNAKYRNLMQMQHTFGGALTLDKGVKKTSKIGDLLIESAPYKSQVTKQTKVLENFADEIIKGGADSPETMTAAAKKAIDTVEAQLDALRYLKAPTTSRIGKTLLKAEQDINRISELAYSTKGTQEILKKIKDTKIAGIAIPDEKILKMEQELLLNKHTLEQMTNELKKVSGRNVNTNLMSIWILAGTVNSMPFLPPEFKKGINLMAGLFTIKKWSPSAAEEMLKVGKGLGNKLNSVQMSDKNKLIVKNLIESMLGLESL